MVQKGLFWSFLILLSLPIYAQQIDKKVLFQGFWWDYKNSNYPNGWANYLTDLAPRLAEIGIDAVWIPPSVKNLSFGEPGVGYAPFDHYDLGDKFQKGSVHTRLGTKDELLRMIAVFHANGIEVVQDIVPNHVIGAGSNTGKGGEDPESTNDKYANFRYVCYQTPAINETESEYLSRRGRFPKNYHNFHPNPAHNCSGGDICSQFFGPDICFADDAFGQSSNALYNPVQSGTENNGYMRKGMRDWMIWYKKQTGFDGVRVDAVKHFDFQASEDFLYNLQFNAGFASGGDQMFAVGEYVGSSSELDNWYQAVNKRAGVFDFNLRAFDRTGGLYNMVYGMGNFDVSLLAGAQQTEANRTVYYSSIDRLVHKTVPFINNHDTFRPRLDEKGNYNGWNGGSELSAHIEPNEPRLATAYAVILAMDGNPQIFFEDLFDIGYRSNRFDHLPSDLKGLPVHEDIKNLIQCHQKLDFKSGPYKVRSAEASTHFEQGTPADHLIIERSGKAIVGVNDSWEDWQNAWINTDFPPGTNLMDYSGANGTDVKTVQGDGRLNVNTPPVNPELNIAGRHGYSVWAPVPANSPFSSVRQMQDYLSEWSPVRNPETTQEWELADDLGDRHCESLGQGGALPDLSTNYRIAGKIFVAKNRALTCELFPTESGRELTLAIFDRSGRRLQQTHGTGTLVLRYTPDFTGWITIKARNYRNTYEGQRCFVKATYIAPEAVITKDYPSANTSSVWTGNGVPENWRDCRNWEEGRVPKNGDVIVFPDQADHTPLLPKTFERAKILKEDGKRHARF